MVVLASRLVRAHSFHVVGLLGQLLARKLLSLVLVEGGQQSHGKRPRRTHPRATGNICHCTDLDPAVETRVQQALAQQGMLDGADVVHLLGARVFDADEVLDLQRVELDVDVLVYGGAENEAAVFLVVRWQIRAAATQGYAQRRSRRNHSEGKESVRADRSGQQLPVYTCPRSDRECR